MRSASARLQEEKVAWLRRLTPEESLAVYLDLWQTCAARFDREKPSEYLLRLQRVYRRMLETRDDNGSTRSSD